MLAGRGYELPSQDREILDVAGDHGAPNAEGVQELASVVELGVAGNLVSTHDVQSPGTQYLGDPR